MELNEIVFTCFFLHFLMWLLQNLKLRTMLDLLFLLENAALGHLPWSTDGLFNPHLAPKSTPAGYWGLALCWRAWFIPVSGRASAANKGLPVTSQAGLEASICSPGRGAHQVTLPGPTAQTRSLPLLQASASTLGPGHWLSAGLSGPIC